MKWRVYIFDIKQGSEAKLWGTQTSRFTSPRGTVHLFVPPYKTKRLHLYLLRVKCVSEIFHNNKVDITPVYAKYTKYIGKIYWVLNNKIQLKYCENMYITSSTMSFPQYLIVTECLYHPTVTPSDVATFDLRNILFESFKYYPN